MKIKTTLSILALISSASAFAFPTVGDQAVYNMTVQGQSAVYTMTVAAIDTTQGQMTLTDSISVGGSVVSTDSNQQDTASMNQDYSNPAVCAVLGNGAVMETITVAMGTYQACHITETINGGQDDLWLASIPFAIVKETVNQNGSMTSIELASETVQ